MKIALFSVFTTFSLRTHNSKKAFVRRSIRRTVGRDSESRQLLLFWGVVNYHNTLSVFMKRHRTSSPNGENKPTLRLLSLSTTAVGVGDARAILRSLVRSIRFYAIVMWQ